MRCYSTVKLKTVARTYTIHSMKICLVSRHMTLKGNGIGRCAAQLHKGLVERGHQVSVVHDGESLPAYLWFSTVRKPILLPHGQDVYHALSPVESLWLPEHKTVVSVHDLFPVMYPQFQGSGVGENRVNQWFAGEFFAHCLFKSSICRSVACNSGLTEKQYVDFIAAPWLHRTPIIYWGISPDLYPVAAPSGRMKFGYLGQLDRRKRVDVLIQSFRWSRINADLLIAGTGRDEAKLRELAGGDERIKFLGFLPDTKLRLFYNSLTALILPSYMEGWGLPAVEAMACGTPVVILADTIIPYEIRERCWQPVNLRHWFDAMMDCVPPKRGQYVEWAMGHTWDRCVGQYEELYRSIKDDTADFTRA